MYRYEQRASRVFFTGYDRSRIKLEWKIGMYLIVPTYKKFDSCVTLIQSAYSQKIHPEATIVYDNSGGAFSYYLDKHDIKLPKTCSIKTQEKNYGCARIWNKGLKDCFSLSEKEYVLVSNDDIVFKNDVIGRFEKTIEEQPENIIYCPELGVNAFSLFATRFDRLLNSVGLFDEHFQYPYYEDGDMARRIMLCGETLCRISDIDVDHIGSATLKSYSREEEDHHHCRFTANGYYMMRKWNLANPDRWDDPNGYATPFNSDYTIQIMAENTIHRMYHE